MRPDRGQSEVLGTILLVALVVIGVSTFGAFVILGGNNQESPTVIDIRPETTDGELPNDITDLSLAHNGGDRVALTDLKLLVQRDGSSCELLFEDHTLSDGDGEFEGGDTWSVDSGAYGGQCSSIYTGGDVVRLIVVDEARSISVYNERWTVAT